jgi:hypothetical protein
MGLSEIVRNIAHTIEAFLASANADATSQLRHLIDSGHEPPFNVRPNHRQFRERPAHEDAEEAIVGWKGKEDLVPPDAHVEPPIEHVAPVREILKNQAR